MAGGKEKGAAIINWGVCGTVCLAIDLFFFLYFSCDCDKPTDTEGLLPLTNEIVEESERTIHGKKKVIRRTERWNSWDHETNDIMKLLK